MDQRDLDRCQELLQYRFNDPSLLALALTHSSVAATRQQSNERLEFLGDAVLGLVVCHELYEKYVTLMEGDMTQIKSSVVSRTTCACIADDVGFCEVLHMGKGMAADGLPTSISAAVFEAIIGAIYLDGGIEAARPFIMRLVRPHIAECLADEFQRNFKSQLQQHAQRTWNRSPAYHLLDEKGPDHSKCFEVAVSIDGRQFSSAWGRNKKDAEQKAAQRALEDLGVLKDECEQEG